MAAVGKEAEMPPGPSPSLNKREASMSFCQGNLSNLGHSGAREATRGLLF